MPLVLLVCTGCSGEEYVDSCWKRVYTTYDDLEELFAVGGCCDDNAYAFGSDITLRYDGEYWQDLGVSLYHHIDDVWVTSSGEVALAGGNEVTLYAGEQWHGHRLVTDLEQIFLYGVWADGIDNVFVVGSKKDQGAAEEYNYISHFDGSEWHEMSIGDECGLYDIWGTSDSNLIAVGCGIFQYDGQAWAEIDTGNDAGGAGIWGVSDDDIYVLSGSDVYHFDGEGWAKREMGIEKRFHRIWGSGPDNIWAMGQRGAVAHYNGSMWEDVSTNQKYSTWDLWVSPSGKPYIVGYIFENKSDYYPHGFIITHDCGS
jgi:hypothetical protein